MELGPQRYCECACGCPYLGYEWELDVGDLDGSPVCVRCHQDRHSAYELAVMAYQGKLLADSATQIERSPS